MGGDSAHETDEAGPDKAKTKRDEPTTQVKAGCRGPAPTSSTGLCW